MLNYLRLTLAVIVGCFLSSCTVAPKPLRVSAVHAQHMHVRTTAYARGEGSGSRNALGFYLSGRHVKSAASDWSRFPLGTRFRIVGTDEEYVIDDYGTALIGTNTIDLYKPSRLEMKRWGVRHVNINVLQWGSREESLKVLAPRSKHRIVRRMMLALQKKSSSPFEKASSSID
jgi:3D (Asp-Asp-Asp) domain-containing protein